MFVTEPHLRDLSFMLWSSGADMSRIWHGQPFLESPPKGINVYLWIMKGSTTCYAALLLFPLEMACVWHWSYFPCHFLGWDGAHGLCRYRLHLIYLPTPLSTPSPTAWNSNFISNGKTTLLRLIVMAGDNVFSGAVNVLAGHSFHLPGLLLSDSCYNSLLWSHHGCWQVDRWCLCYHNTVVGGADIV